MQRRGNKIGVIRSTKGVNLLRTCTRDAVASVEGVARGIGDLADVASHDEVGVVDGRITGQTKEGCV